MKKYLTKPGRIILFIILPCIFLLLSMLLKSEMGYYHLFTTDPEYAYLVNGLNICNFRPPSQVQGPGTPSQFFAAVLIEMVHAFRQQGTLIEDVMQNPDVYISAFHASLTAITAILILILGLTLSKLTKNIYIGLFVQIIPFTSWQILDLMRRYMVENMIIAGMLMLFIFLFLFIYTEDLSVKRIRLYTVIFSICIGFIAATKLMYLPVAIIPFMILPGYRYKIYYFIFSILAFSLFAFPIFFSWHTFWDWHVQNFLHAGQYGSGAATVIDPYQFAKNLKTVLIYDGTFRYIFLILFIGVLVYQIPAIKVKRESDKEYYALAGIVICMTIMTFLVSKQLKYYYMITAILLEVPGIILLFKIFARSPFKNIVVPITFILSGLFIFKFYQETLTNISVHDRYMQRKENYMEAFHYANTELKGKPTLLIADYYGAPYKEYGIFFGISWGGLNNKIRYAPTLNKLYPNV
ncbi:MAG: hypothetical protein U0T82_10585, partial [Bacteroidales bacterium]